MASRTRIGALQFDVEASFGDNSINHAAALASNNFFLEAQGVEIGGPGQEAIEDAALRMALVKLVPIPGSKRAAKLSFKIRMRDENAVTPTANFALAKLLSYAWGEGTWDTGHAKVTVTGGADTTHFTCSDAGNAFFKVGNGVVVRDTTGSASRDLRWIVGRTNVAAVTTVTLNRALAFTPANLDVAYAGHTIFPIDTIDSGISLYFRFTEEGTDQCWELFGCTAEEVKFGVEEGVPMVSFTYRVADWRNKTAQTLPTARSWAFGKEIPYLFHQFLLDGSNLDIRAGWEFMLGMKLADYESPKGQGVGSREFSDRSVEGSYSPKWGLADWQRFSAQTEHEIQMSGQVGADAGVQHWGFFVGKAHLLNNPEPADADGLKHIECKWRAGQYSGDVTDLDSAAINTDARIFIGTSDNA